MRKKAAVKKAPAARAVVDPTLEFTPIVIGGKVYRMCFDLGALAEAEDALIARGHKISILDAFPRMTLSSTRIMFAASLHKFHPEIGFEQAMELLTLPYVYKAGNAIADAWGKCLALPDENAAANPIQPGE